MVWGLAFWAGGRWGAGSNPSGATSSDSCCCCLFLFSFFYYYYYFLSSYYYPLACFCLFSLLLASRDFCDNVFLYILLMLIVSSEHVCWSIRNVKFDVIEVSYTMRLLFLVFVTAVCYPSKYKIQIMIDHFWGALKHAIFNPSWWFVFGVTF